MVTTQKAQVTEHDTIVPIRWCFCVTKVGNIIETCKFIFVLLLSAKKRLTLITRPEDDIFDNPLRECKGALREKEL